MSFHQSILMWFVFFGVCICLAGCTTTDGVPRKSVEAQEAKQLAIDESETVPDSSITELPGVVEAGMELQPDYPWDDVNASRKRFLLQAVNFFEKKRQIREHGSKIKCPGCSRSGNELTWFYFSSPSWTWRELCGRAGWMVVCDKCHTQVAFFTEIMN